MTTELTVTVTRGDLEEAHRRLTEGGERCKNCAIAVAIKREYPEWDIVSVGYTTGYLYTASKGDKGTEFISVPSQAQELIDAFDDNDPVHTPQTLTFKLRPATR